MNCGTPTKQHQWLMKLVGKWTFTGEGLMGPGQPTFKFKGSERVSALGEFWIVAEGSGKMPDGKPCVTRMTLGYNPENNRYVGTWIGSMMSNLWIYEGSLDRSGKVLTLSTTGPDMTGKARTAKYRDVIEIKSASHRVLSSWAQGPNKKWVRFMTAHYRKSR